MRALFSARHALARAGGLGAVAFVLGGLSSLKPAQGEEARPPPPRAAPAPPPQPTHEKHGQGSPLGAVPGIAGAAGEREFTREEVARHKDLSTGVWVTYQDGVYDITEFVKEHPGGSEKIMLAAGSAVDPFWRLYAVHSQNKEVPHILARHRIGRLTQAEVEAMRAERERAVDPADPYSSDPEREAAIRPLTTRPFNGEPPGPLIADHHVTPTAVHFVRNHLPVPVVDPETYRLAVEVPGGRTLSLALDELRALPQREVTVTLQCAGNRRGVMASGRPIKGLLWQSQAIGTAVYRGPLLRDVLRSAGLSDEQVDAGSVAHIHLVGLDSDSTTSYAASVPVGKVMSPAGDVVLALDMNGEPLPRDHGSPVRAVVPGIVAARSVKWLGKVSAEPGECQGHWMQKDYKSFNPSVDWDTVDWSKAPAMQEMPVTSAIASPQNEATATAGEDLVVRGWAWSGGGRAIIRVDVSHDEGKTWSTAELLPPPAPQLPGRAWAWTLWEATIPIPRGVKGGLSLICKAVDESYNNQPESSTHIWNLRGVANNAWDRVHINITEPKDDSRINT
jgi:sulfite oxidase